MKAGGIILAGGQSSRMGSNKALLKIAEKTSIERISLELKKSQIIKNTILVTNEPESYKFLKLKNVSDYYPGMGPLAGIHAGLLASEAEANLVVACDMPFVTHGVADFLLQQLRDYEAVIPVIDGFSHPLFAVYTKQMLRRMEECLEKGHLRLKQLLKEANVLYIHEADLVSFSMEELERNFFNMNHPQEYENAKKLLKANIEGK